MLSMLQNLGKKTAFIGKVGADAFGQMLIKTVAEQGINTDNLLVDNEVPTTLAFVHTDQDGDRSFSFYRNPGADMMLRWDEIRKDMLADTKIFHFGTLSMTDEQIENVTKKADLFDMLQLANAAASLITTRKGALRVMPKYEEITALIEDKSK